MRFGLHASAEDFRALLLTGNTRVREEFYALHQAGTDAAIGALTSAYAAFRRHEATSGALDERTAHVHAFLWTAFNSLLSSLFLLISGLLPASGNQMRQFAEATAMALLCSDPRIDTLIRVKKSPARFPYHTALALVNRRENRQKLKLGSEAWKGFMDLSRFYDDYSHANLLTVASNAMLDIKGQIILLSEYDPAKASVYEWEVNTRTQGARVLKHLTDVLTDRLPFDPNSSTP